VTLHFVPFVHGYDFSDPELDCSILFGDGHWPGARSHYLAGNDVALIAPRKELAEVDIRSPQDVTRCTLLRHVTVPEAWQRWSEAQTGLPEMDTLAGPQFDQFQTMIRAVSVGMGVALVPRCLVQDEITAGTVAEPLPGGGYTSELGYWLCYPEARAHLATLVRFRDWLLAAPKPVA
jgi:DNA-binding transcriptional LysR family regulator